MRERRRELISRSFSGTPPPAAGSKEALLAEKLKLEAEISVKQKRLEEIAKLMAGK